MTRDEFLKIVRVLKTNYTEPSFLPDKEAIEVWYRCLSDIPYAAASVAATEVMTELTRVPRIADIRERAKKPSEIAGLNAEQAWALVSRARRNGIYGSEEEYARLPELVQQAIGSADSLCKMAMMPSDQVESVEKSHFVRTYNELVRRAEREAQAPAYIREIHASNLRQSAELRDRKAREAAEALDAKPAGEIEASETRATLDQIDEHMAAFYKAMADKMA
ncbi:MAG: hypothetical protein ACI4W2_04800 [Eubacterium sp.]